MPLICPAHRKRLHQPRQGHRCWLSSIHDLHYDVSRKKGGAHQASKRCRRIDNPTPSPSRLAGATRAIAVPRLTGGTVRDLVKLLAADPELHAHKPVINRSYWIIASGADGGLIDVDSSHAGLDLRVLAHEGRR